MNWIGDRLTAMVSSSRPASRQALAWRVEPNLSLYERAGL